MPIARHRPTGLARETDGQVEEGGYVPHIRHAVEGTVIVGLFSYLHEQFHMRGSQLNSSKSFACARERHFLHYDRRVNFAVYDHFRDIAFGTFLEKK